MVHQSDSPLAARREFVFSFLSRNSSTSTGSIVVQVPVGGSAVSVVDNSTEDSWSMKHITYDGIITCDMY